MTKPDKYKQALEQLRSLCFDLAGGYYETLSDRDAELAQEVFKLMDKHLARLKQEELETAAKPMAIAFWQSIT